MTDETAPDWRVDLSYYYRKGGSPEESRTQRRDTSSLPQIGPFSQAYGLAVLPEGSKWEREPIADSMEFPGFR